MLAVHEVDGQSSYPSRVGEDNLQDMSSGASPGWTAVTDTATDAASDTPIINVEEPGGFVYHYTSAAGLAGIVDGRRDANVSRRLTFFASDVLGMNDLTELAFGLDIVRRHVVRLADGGGPQSQFFQKWLPVLEKYLAAPTLESLQQAPRACVCATSFTTSDDLLSQWVTYGSGGGFAIGLEAQTLRSGIYTGHNVRTGEPRDFQCALNRVYYGDDARARIDELPLFKELGIVGLPLATALQTLVSVVSALGDMFKDPERRPPPDVGEHASAALAIGIAAQYKHDAFKAEDEWRLLVGGGTTGDLAKLLSGHYPPNFRAAGARLVPFRPVTVGPTGDQPVIRDLVVGPAPDQVQLVHAAQQLLIANGHDPGVVRASPIPYRGW